MDQVLKLFPDVWARLLESLRAPAKEKRREVHLGDKVFYLLLKGCAWSVVFLLLGMIGLIGYMSYAALSKFGLITFLFTNDWDVVNEIYGAAALVYGTVVSSLVALVIAVPISVGVALYLNELAPRWISAPISFLVEMLAAIPSIVYGLWGIFVLAPFLRNHIQPFLTEYFGFTGLFTGPPIGVGMLCAGVILAIMITPTIAAICKEVFRALPGLIREGALGLGATRWEMIKIAVLKSSVSGIIGATILGLGRALGETMAVTMVIGNQTDIKMSLFAPAQTMASVLANEYAEANSDMHLSALTAVGLVLFIVSLFINSIARYIVYRVEKEGKGS